MPSDVMSAGKIAVAMLLTLALALGGCASTPENRERREWWDVYWGTARQCLRDFTNFAIDDIGMDGRLHLDGHISTGIDEFRQCYWNGLAAEITRRRAAGVAVPDWVNAHPAVDIDIADPRSI